MIIGGFFYKIACHQEFHFHYVYVFAFCSWINLNNNKRQQQQHEKQQGGEIIEAEDEINSATSQA